MKGYCGKILRVDLSERAVTAEGLDEAHLRNYLGQVGLAARYLYDEVGPEVEPLSPANRLILMTGPLTGTVAPTSARYEVVAVSPQTGAYGEANSGGFFGPELKFAGFDGVIIEGRAEKPVYLWVGEGRAELRDAAHLWGRDTFETEDALRAELADRKVRVACIGPAGEKLVRFAAVMNDKGRAAARTGLGAVMGSKNLKAVAVRGTKRVPVADGERLKALAQKMNSRLRASPGIQFLGKYGTDGWFLMREARGYGIARYWTRDLSQCPDKRGLSGELMAESILVGRFACYRCPIACGRVVEVREGPYALGRSHGPEYETVAALGSQCDNWNLESVAKANDLCNRLGLDTISTGSVVAFAMECYERGLITRAQADGLELNWGNGAAVVQLVERIGRREGLGDLLAEGVKGAAERIGGEASRFALHVKGVEIAMHDPRSCQGWGLGYATSGAGGHHTEGGIWSESGVCIPPIGLDEPLDPKTPQGKPEALIKVQDLITSALSSLGLCYFAYVQGGCVDLIAPMLSAATGWKIELDEIMAAGERIFNLKRAFNVRRGVGRHQDILPARFLAEPLPAGKVAGVVNRLGEMLDEYYRLRGWEPERGVPTREKLTTLGLDDVARDLW